MGLSEFLTIIAILLAPLVAIQVSKYLADRKAKKERKMHVFRALMATRGSRLSIDHINALNMIDIEFYGKSKESKDVVEAWKTYLDHLENKVLLDSSLESWGSKGPDLFYELLEKMSICLEYDLSKTVIKKTSYIPEAYGQIEDAQLIIRKGLTSLFSGDFSIPIHIESGESKEKQENFRTLLEDYLKGKNTIKVSLVKQDGVENNQL
ncbi:MAG: hypothetical protein JSU85_01705 [Candidatus Zixiibacteriota bacterium]|nr:MAG: hypothetical protein JSU85_01705 [candidate division Zixibacteria bacterium]